MGSLSDYRSLDYYNLDQLLTEEQRQVRRTVRAFVTEKVLPDISEHFENQTFPEELIPQMAELGFFGANLHGYGMAGIDNISYGLMMQELERGDSGLRSMASVQGALVMYPIYAFGSEEQKQKYLPGMARGEIIGCFGLTEPNHGSDPAGMETHAVEDGDSYVLNGNKTWITNANVCDVAIVWARLGDHIRGFLVEKETPGFSTAKIEDKFSMRASHTGEIYLHDCRVPKSQLLPEVEGLKGPLSCLNQARYGISWGVLGAAMACYDEALSYTIEREQFGKPIASYQLVQEKLAEMVSQITQAQLLCYRLGQLKDEGKVLHTQVSLAKRNNCRMALNVARMTRDLLGGNGITLDYQAIRHMVNLETVYTYEGTDHIHTLVIGADVTGIQAFR